MRNSKKLAAGARFAISLGLALLLIGGFVLFGGFGVDNYAAAAPYADKTDNNANTDNNGVGNAGVNNPNNPHFVNSDPIGGNAHLTTYVTESTQISGVSVLTRIQNGQPTRVCVEHVVDGRTNVRNFDPFKNPNANDIVQDIIEENGGGPRVNPHGNETWQLCGAETTTTTTTTATTTATTVTPGEVVSGVEVTFAPVVTPAPVVVETPAPILGVQLPRAGGLPLLPGALAFLGSLLFTGGVLLRRFVR